MTASSPITFDDLVNGLKLYAGEDVWNISYNEPREGYFVNDGIDYVNSVEISENGLTISFGEFGSGPRFTRFTFNA